MGQNNIVPNPSFEILDTCPYSDQQVHFAFPWQDLCGSPDLYNTCAPIWGNNSCPGNWTGYQLPHSGNGYAGIAIYNYFNGSNSEIREYISVQLNNPLDSGKLYCLELYTSRADWAYYAVNRLGVYISPNPLVPDNQGDTINVTPQVTWDSVLFLDDTSSWTRISDIYSAAGGERYIAIGNFYGDSETDTLGQLGGYIWAYYYIDDVSVYELQECNAGEDVSICYKDSITLGTTAAANLVYEWMPTAGLSDPSVANPLASPDTSTVYILKQTECDAVLFDTVKVTINRDCHTAPSIMVPTLVTSSQAFFIRGLESNSQLDIYDLRGRLIFASDDYQNDFIFSHEEQAFYIAVLTRPDGEQVCEKIFVVKE